MRIWNRIRFPRRKSPSFPDQGVESQEHQHRCRAGLRTAWYPALLIGVVLWGGAANGASPPVPDGQLLQREFGDADVSAFKEPAEVFRPETWFHFIGGNVATQGITADLEAIARAGIGGVQLFHGQFGGAWPGMEHQIKCLSGSWDEAVRHTAEECRRLGLRFTMQNCPGWAMAGGPWITPDKAMRHLVCSRTDLAGGSNLSVTLPQPQPSQEEWRDYRDVAVVAFPTPDGDTGKALAPASVKSNREGLPWEKCLRNEKDGKIVLEPRAEPVWVEATFEDVVTLRTVELPSVQGFNHSWCYVPGVTVTVQAVTPQGLKDVARYEMPQSNWQDNKPITLACSEVPARYYRITIDNKHTMTFPHLQLFSGARKHNWEAEAAFTLRGLNREPHPQQSKTTWCDAGQVLDLTDKMDAQGNLHWEAPQGHWTVLRWGHVNTGKRNGPAPPEATGWECDKLSPVGAETHFAAYIGRLAAKNGPVGNGLMQGMLLDSWECETQTWTPGMDTQFSRLRGYALKPWLPALAGYVIGDPEITARFLCDWRTTVNDLVVENFFGRMAKLGHQSGLAISFETASGDVFPGDILEYYKHADVPMCEFWHPRSESFVGSLEFKPVKPCVSAARVYGKPRVAAEAFTSFDLTWNEHPRMLKGIADMHLAEGVTHLVFHTYTHNPRTDWLPPGTAFGSGIGTPFLRGQTWWPQMREFTAYLARCSYLLERGRPVSDVLWYLGDEQDHKPRQDAPFPTGYHYDYCNRDILLHRLRVKDGMLVTPEGLRYRVLWLRDCPRMQPQTLERILALVKKGAVVVGDPPRGLATLSGGERAERKFRQAVEALWGEKRNEVSARRVGKGTVIPGMPLGDALTTLGIEPDVQGDRILWTHRRTEGADWYFVAASEQGFQGAIRFRSTGAVELWNPVSGEVRSAGVVRQEGGMSVVALDLPASGSVFVVFRGNHTTTGNPVVQLEHAWEPGLNRGKRKDGMMTEWEARTPRQIPVTEGWALEFPEGWGAPASMRVDALRSWTELGGTPEARAFSGTATYKADFVLDTLGDASRVEVDLGRVEVIAQVHVNGQPAGCLWSSPYRLDITGLVKAGTNHLAVAVTSTWFNRLVYDAGLNEKDRKTWTISGPAKDRALVPAGLLGPVVVRVGETLDGAKRR